MAMVCVGEEGREVGCKGVKGKAVMCEGLLFLVRMKTYVLLMPSSFTHRTYRTIPCASNREASRIRKQPVGPAITTSSHFTLSACEKSEYLYVCVSECEQPAYKIQWRGSAFPPLNDRELFSARPLLLLRMLSLRRF